MRKEDDVRLTDDERQRLVDFTTKGFASAGELRRARSLLLADAGQTDAAIAAAVGCCANTVARVRRRHPSSQAWSARPPRGAARAARSTRSPGG